MQWYIDLTAVVFFIFKYVVKETKAYRVAGGVARRQRLQAENKAVKSGNATDRGSAVENVVRYASRIHRINQCKFELDQLKTHCNSFFRIVPRGVLF